MNEYNINGEDVCGKASYGVVQIKNFIGLTFEKIVENIKDIESLELIIDENKKELLVHILKSELIIKAFKELQDKYYGYFWINEQNAIINFGKYVNVYFPSISINEVVEFMSKKTNK